MWSGGWNPWRALRDRPHLTLKWGYIDGAIGLWDPTGAGRADVWLDARLGRVARRCVLAHELVHDERRGGSDLPGMPDSWRSVVASDERAVDDEVARRLVPFDDLAEFCRCKSSVDEPVTAEDVASFFDVTPSVARRAMKLWKQSKPERDRRAADSRTKKKRAG